VTAPEPMRGDIWSFLPTVAGRGKPSVLGADRVLVLSTSIANAVLPTVLALPVVANAPRMPALAVVLSADDPSPGCSVVVYQAKPVYRPWLVERIVTVTEASLRSVFAVMVGYLDR
jgi:mRNA-degrading endonuclease toxin of MazEF toxin-antitoxin module